MFSFLPSILMPRSQRSIPKVTPKPMPKPEEVMAEYVMSRNQKAIIALYKMFADDMYHYIVTLSDPTLAKDIVQKTWLKVIEKPYSYHTAGSVKAWLFTLARNALIDEFRKTKRWVELDDNLDNVLRTSLDGGNELTCCNNNLKLCFDDALMVLPFEQREAFCLQQEGFSLADISTMTHAKQETIKTRLRYAKNKLKELLEQAND